MRRLKILIPHNKPPFVNDLMTTQCKKICSELEKKFELKIIWVIYPTDENLTFEGNDPNIIYAEKYSNAIEILETVHPDLVMINGSMDFHNVSTALASKYKQIPMVVIFFRNFIHVISTPTKKSIKVRLRSGFTYPKFYINQYVFLIKTLKKINYSFFKMSKFLLSYSNMIFFSYFPINNVISGDINLCKDEKWTKKLIETGFDKSSIFVVGDPYFDSLSKEKQNSKITKIENNKTKILFCTAALSAHNFCSKKEENELIIDVVNEILKHEDFEIDIKIHPSTVSREDYEKEVLPKLSSRVMVYQAENLTELINQYHVILTYGGTGAIHNAALIGKPIVNLDFKTNTTANNVFIDDKIITQCERLSNLSSDIKQSKMKTILENDIQQYIDKYIGISDGKSSIRAADAIFDLVNKKTT